MKKSLLILTGHTKGLGKAILDHYLSRQNFHIIAISRSSLGREYANLTEFCLDLSDLSVLEGMLPMLFPKGDFERVVLINNAGWIGEIKSIGNLSTSGIQKVLNLNLLAPIILCNSFVRAYRDQQAEKIICNISSGAAHKPLSGWAEYCSSKAGLAMFSQVAAEELTKEGFQVFSLAPGIVDTEMQAEIRQADESDFPALDRFVHYKSSNQLSSVEKVSEKIVYLLTHPGQFSGVIQDVRAFDLP